MVVYVLVELMDGCCGTEDNVLGVFSSIDKAKASSLAPRPRQETWFGGKLAVFDWWDDHGEFYFGQTNVKDRWRFITHRIDRYAVDEED